MDAVLSPICLPDVLRDGDLLLDSHRIEDAETHWAREDDEMRRRFDSRRRATLDEMRLAMQRWMDGRANGGPMFAYAARQTPHGLVGGCELRLITPERANISYWLYPQYRGRGLAFRATSLLCEAAAAVENLVQLEAHIAPDNAASRRLAERLGFVESGLAEEEAWDGVKSMVVIYVRPVPR
jgi:RimJ/RimL family protein N-acetyltransferase